LTYFERLRAAAVQRRSQLCVGLDPDPDRIPGGVTGALKHCARVVELTQAHACCYKPNSAFWEQYGPDGWIALAELRTVIPSDIPVLLDAKRADVGNTMSAYARAVYVAMGMDAATVHAYHGADSLMEFTRYADRGVYVVCRTSNPGAADLQHLDAGGMPLYRRVVELAGRVDTAGNVGLVVGATAPAEIAAVRAAAPGMPFLIPGIGAQEGDLEGSVRAAWNGDPAGCLIAASRSILYSAEPAAQAEELQASINSVISALAAR
jgi:orotidine-5'-phosphate decarboxylase